MYAFVMRISARNRSASSRGGMMGRFGFTTGRSAGVRWGQDARRRAPPDDLPRRLAETVGREVERSEAALHDGRYRYFAANLPPREHWRALPEFGDRIAYLDIETTGLSAGRDAVTVVGLYDGRRTMSFVRGANLEELPEALDGAKLLVTFNGARFDVPFLRAAFPRMRLDQIHVDLLYPLRRLGFQGGLKRIERRVGLPRSEATQGLGGFDAVRLWRAYERGDGSALDLLLEYNLEDVVNLEPLAGIAYAGLRALRFGESFVTADRLEGLTGPR